MIYSSHGIRLWNPDILMYDSASEEFDSTYPVNIVVYQDGKCKYGPPAIFQSTCQVISYKNFRKRIPICIIRKATHFKK